jgi:hypothetical protein
MGHGICERPAAVLTICFLGFSPALAMGQAGGTTETPAALETGGFNSASGFNSEWGLRPGPCPTRFDYVVLASFADASSLLGLSTYHFRSEVGFSRVPLTGWLRVDFKVGSAGTNCRSRTRFTRQQPG